MQIKPELIRGPMITTIKERKRQKKQNQIKTTSITYDQNSMSIHLKNT